MPEETGKTGILPPSSLEEPAKDGLSERRGQARYSFSADAEVMELQSRTRLSGRCSDLGPGGCYVDLLTPLPVGAEIRVCLTRNKRKFEAAATVTYSVYALGMGMRFTEMTHEYGTVLNAWIEELRGGPSLSVPATNSANGSTGQDTNWLIVLNQLIALLVRKNVLSRDESVEFLRKIFR